MSADRDYWTELKQLLRWHITPGLPLPPVKIVRARLAHPGSYQFVRARPGSSGLVRARPAHPGSYQFVRARSGSSGLIWLVKACPARFGSFGLVRARPACLGLSRLHWQLQNIPKMSGGHSIHPQRPRRILGQSKQFCQQTADLDGHSYPEV